MDKFKPPPKACKAIFFFFIVPGLNSISNSKNKNSKKHRKFSRVYNRELDHQLKKEWTLQEWSIRANAKNDDDYLTKIYTRNFIVHVKRNHKFLMSTLFLVKATTFLRFFKQRWCMHGLKFKNKRNRNDNVAVLYTRRHREHFNCKDVKLDPWVRFKHCGVTDGKFFEYLETSNSTHDVTKSISTFARRRDSVKVVKHHGLGLTLSHWWKVIWTLLSKTEPTLVTLHRHRSGCLRSPN